MADAQHRAGESFPAVEPSPRPLLETERIGELELFRNVSSDALAGYREAMEVIDLRAGQELLIAGTRNRRVYGLLHGRLRIHLDEPAARPLRILEAGESVGEMSIVDGGAVSAHVLADTDCSLLVLEEDVLWAMVDSSHAVARNLLHMLSGRLRFDNAAIVDSQAAQRQWQHYATVDALTGLHNRLWLEDMLPRHVGRARRDGESVALLMLDVDHFKQFNDEHGHLIGDQALRELATILCGTLRPGDAAARYGGEEFVVILPGKGLEEARIVAERLRRAVDGARVHTPEGPTRSPTISVGAAALREADPQALLAAADAALYRAKRAGRNRVSD